MSRDPNKLDAFHVGNDGGVYTAAWEGGVNNNNWAGWWRVCQLTAKPGSLVSAVSREPAPADISLSATTASSTPLLGTLAERLEGLVGYPWRPGSAGGAVTAVSRDPNKLDVFVVSGDGGVYTAAWEGGVNNNNWAGWWRIGSLQAKPGSVVSAVLRDPHKLDIFAVGHDGIVYTAAWDAAVAGGWRGWSGHSRRHGARGWHGYSCIASTTQARCLRCERRFPHLHGSMGSRHKPRQLVRVVAHR